MSAEPAGAGGHQNPGPTEAGPTGPSPAERYSRARKRAAADRTELARFALEYPFGLDDFQVQACQALEAGRGVLVAAPTGSGKTVVGEFAVHLALVTGRKAFYTTPIKALSNQKYTDLVARYGADRVGLLTGDNTVNGEAPVVVMTTEVLRNMLYAGSSTLTDLGFVVMDEVHYLADRFRGAVWEEVIIHLPESVQLASLSATVSNAEEFGAWLTEVRGDTEIVVSEHRPVPLWQHVLVGRQLHDLFGERGVNPELLRVADRDRAERGVGSWRGGGRGRRGRDSGPPRRGGRSGPGRADVLITLDQAGLLPAITFIFSRAGCEAAVSQCLAAGLWLTTTEERERIRAEVDRRCAAIPPEDLDVLGFWAWREALERGVAAHHAGLLPTFKEVVEELVAAGLVKAVFATETLALGINVPARSVVLEKLVKWNGETHAEVTPGEYTQLTGRAGRRGIDVEGHAVVLWQSGLDPEAVAGLASTRTYPLRSSFRPTYNMAVNLVDQVGRNRAREILETSFAQFQADRAVVGLSRQLQRHEEALAGYTDAMTCHLGDFAEYMGLRRAIADREATLSRRDATDRTTAAQESVQHLRRGDVIRMPTGRRTGWAVVIELGGPGRGAPLTVLTADRHVHRFTENELTQELTPLTRVPVPASFNARNPQSRRDLASTLRNALGAADHDRAGKRAKRRAAAADDLELNRLRARLRAHPCHGCAEREDHARWAERHQRLAQEATTLRRRIDGRTSSIARTFDRVCEMLDERDYLRGETVTAAGQRLKRIYGESDLLVAECLREGAWAGLDAAALAACVSAVVYSSRGDDRGQTERQVPNPKLREALAQTSLTWAGLDEAERRIGLDVTREIDLGLVVAMHRWARGQALERVLADGDLSAGDFVRWCRQVIDLLGQIQKAAADAPDGQALRATAQQAIEAVRRGVVAFSSVA